MNIHLASALAVALALTAGQSAAQATKFPLEIRSTGKDALGSRLAYRLREMALSSQQFTSRDRGARLILSLVTMSPHTRSEDSTLYSASLIFNQPGERRAIVTHWVGQCGADRVAVCAETILATVSTEARGEIPMSDE